MSLFSKAKSGTSPFSGGGGGGGGGDKALSVWGKPKDSTPSAFGKPAGGALNIF